MQKKLVLLIAVVLVLSLGLTAAKDVKIGKEITIEKVTKVSEILEKPDEYLGKTVRVEGFVTDGCMHKGTWVAIAGDKDFQTINIWDKEHKLKFPLEHRGKYVVAQGEVYFIELSEEQATKWLTHLAETHKQKPDLSQAKGGMKVYRVSPTAAMITDKKKESE